MISIQGLRVEFGSVVLLDGISFVINRRDRIALVGRNGAGKSTLLKIIAGHQSPTGGVVARPTDVTIGYLPQQMRLADDCTVREEVNKVFGHVQELDDTIARLNEELQSRTDYESDDYQDLVERLALKTEALALAQSDNYEGGGGLDAVHLLKGEQVALQGARHLLLHLLGGSARIDRHHHTLTNGECRELILGHVVHAEDAKHKENADEQQRDGVVLERPFYPI